MAFDKIDQEQMINSGDLINKIRETAQNCYDLFEFKRIAFNEIKLPKRKDMASKRAFYAKQIITRSQLSLKTDIKETTSQWIRRRSSELLGLKPNICELKVIMSSDASKTVAFRRITKNITEISILCIQTRKIVHKSEWNLKNALITGISNDGKRIICTHSSKTVTKCKDDLQINLIAIDFEPFDGFFVEELDSVININNCGLISKCKLNSKQSDSIIILNDKNLNIVSADLNRNYGLIWLNTVSKDKITHKFISFDINSLDVYTIIESNLFNVHKFVTNSIDKQSIIAVKCDPINGKLKKTIDILTKCSKKQRIFDFYDDIFDIKCFSFDEQIKDCSLGFNYNLLNDSCEQTDNKCLLMVLTKNSSNIYIEYKFDKILRKKIIFIDQIKDNSEITGIKIVRITKKSIGCEVTLLVYTVHTFFIVTDLNLNN